MNESVTHYLDNKQDVGGKTAGDAHAAVDTPYQDAVDASLQEAIKLADKPTALWEWRTHALQLLLSDRRMINAAHIRRHIEAVSLSKLLSYLSIHAHLCLSLLTSHGEARGLIAVSLSDRL